MTGKVRVAALFLLSMSAALFAESSQTPEQLVEHSRETSDLAATGAYQLQATVVLNPGASKEKEIAGTITIVRGKDLYRSELKLRDYRETRWIKNNMLYIARTRAIPVPKTVPLRQLDRLWHVDVALDEIKTKLSKEKDHGKQLDCFESRSDLPKHKFCFDPATSVLVKATGLEGYDLEFQDFNTFEQKYFPRRILFHERNQAVLEVRDIGIMKANLTADAITPQDGSLGLPTCDEPVPPRKIKDENPEIPIEQLKRVGSATVYLYGLVAPNGSVQNISVEYSPHDSFTESAIKALKQWRYTPAMCGNKPVPTEIETHILYFIPGR
jgi:hypothetical protein